MCGDRVDEPAVLLQAIVEVRSRCEAGRANLPDELALPNARPGTDGNRGQVQVFGFEAIGVAQVDHPSRAAAHPRGHDHAVGNSNDGRPGGRAVVHAECARTSRRTGCIRALENADVTTG